jgi:hypothetical protein
MEKSKPLLQLLLFCGGSLLLFYMNPGRSFASDDFEVIHRLVMVHRFWITGFFRPLSDLSLWGNYLAGGLHPAGYYLFNIVVHGVNAFLVYRFFCAWAPEGRSAYGLPAALFFLAYPFHSEGIDWILGRGASLCTLFSLAALLVLVNGRAGRWKLFWAGLLYFTGMAAYEPAILLPFFGIVVLTERGAMRREIRNWLLVMGSVFILHLLLRIGLGGSVAGDYGGAFFRALSPVPGNAVKVMGRLFLPPMEDTRLMIALCVLVVVGLVAALVVLVRRSGVPERRYLFALLLLLTIACLFPVITAVSTRTTESDRMLYLPSVFLCGLLSFLVVELVKRRFWRVAVCGVLLGYMVFFLERANGNWVRASTVTRAILRDAGARATGRMLVIDLPDELDGAFIFRHGFPEACGLLWPADPAPVVVSHIARDEAMGLPDSILPVRDGGVTRIAPLVTIAPLGPDSLLVRYKDSSWRAGGADRVYFWNKRGLRLFR